MSDISCTVSGGVARVFLDRPDKLNGLTLEMLADLGSTARRLARDTSLRAVVMAGTGESFCAGLDFAATMRDPWGIVRSFVPLPWRGTNRFQEACWAWRRLPVPVVAVVRGHCYGGGLQLALAADFRYTTPDAQWSVLEAKWGLVPDMTGIRTLSELVGMDTAKLLTMTGDVITGEHAHSLGLATGVDPDPHAVADQLVDRLVTRSPDALAAAKRLFHQSWTASARVTLARERLAQAGLLVTANTKAARDAAFRREVPVFAPRRR
jgi:enoyl-CoA hydratase/carnithine racemase